jgi:multiple sugar transport system substrate-binding protein
MLVDKNNKVVIDSARDDQGARVWPSELYATFVPGTLCWLDPNNNKAFLDGQISADRQRHLDLLRRQERRTDPKLQGDGGRHPARVASRSARWACRPSCTCSSTR